MQIIAIIVKTTLEITMIMMHIHWIHINKVTMMVIMLASPVSEVC